MERFFTGVVKHRRGMMILFLAAFCICLFIGADVNYDINDYLPADAPSTTALDVAQDAFDGALPNARVLVRDVEIPEALAYKQKLAAISGVRAVTWLDDTADITVPLFAQDAEIESYYKDGAALFTVTVDKDTVMETVRAIRDVVGERGALTGGAVSTAYAMENTIDEVGRIAVFSVLFVLAVLLFTTRSWLEPFVVLGGLGVAIVINNGTNALFGEVSFVTSAAGSILQLAVSLDYSVFLIHRFEECRERAPDVQSAMVAAVQKSAASILSSGLTTVIGFLALVFMQFRIGPDLGLALAKGVAISLVTVFLFMPALILVLYKWMDKTRHRSFVPNLHKPAVLIRKLGLPMVCVFLIVMAPAFLASRHNEYYYGSSEIFGAETEYGQDTRAIESVFGQSDSYMLLVPSGDTATQKALSDELKKLPEVTGILSYVDTVGAEIPPSYLEEDTLALLQNGTWSRMVLSVSVPTEGTQTFALVERIREISKRYYPDDWLLAGAGVSTYDLMDTITADMGVVNLLAIGAVFLVLLVMLRSIPLSAILVLCIETAIWLNLSVPYFSGQPLYYIAYLIISSVQLGATVDYAILLTDRYRENRQFLSKKKAIVKTLADNAASILTSGSALTAAGLLLGAVSSNGLLAQLGVLIGRGALFSLGVVLFVLPGLLVLFDRWLFRQKKAEPVKEEVLQ